MSSRRRRLNAGDFDPTSTTLRSPVRFIPGSYPNDDREASPKLNSPGGQFAVPEAESDTESVANSSVSDANQVGRYWLRRQQEVNRKDEMVQSLQKDIERLKRNAAAEVEKIKRNAKKQISEAEAAQAALVEESSKRLELLKEQHAAVEREWYIQNKAQQTQLGQLEHQVNDHKVNASKLESAFMRHVALMNQNAHLAQRGREPDFRVMMQKAEDRIADQSLGGHIRNLRVVCDDFVYSSCNDLLHDGIHGPSHDEMDYAIARFYIQRHFPEISRDISALTGQPRRKVCLEFFYNVCSWDESLETCWMDRSHNPVDLLRLTVAFWQRYLGKWDYASWLGMLNRHVQEHPSFGGLGEPFKDVAMRRAKLQTSEKQTTELVSDSEESDV